MINIDLSSVIASWQAIHNVFCSKCFSWMVHTIQLVIGTRSVQHCILYTSFWWKITTNSKHRRNIFARSLTNIKTYIWENTVLLAGQDRDLQPFSVRKGRKYLVSVSVLSKIFSMPPDHPIIWSVFKNSFIYIFVVSKRATIICGPID